MLLGDDTEIWKFPVQLTIGISGTIQSMHAETLEMTVFSSVTHNTVYTSL